MLFVLWCTSKVLLRPAIFQRLPVFVTPAPVHISKKRTGQSPSLSWRLLKISSVQISSSTLRRTRWVRAASPANRAS